LIVAESLNAQSFGVKFGRNGKCNVSVGVTNLLVRQGDYTATGQTAMSIIDADGLGGADAGAHAAPQAVPAPGGRAHRFS
jgi:hypothetical protein